MRYHLNRTRQLIPHNQDAACSGGCLERRERSWLSLIALEWIHSGENRLGSDPLCDIVLPSRTAPAQVGVLRLEGEHIVLQLDEGVEATVRGRPITRHAIQPDSTDDPDVIDIGRLSLMVIERGGRWGLRVWDRESPRRRSFPGREWFPVRHDALVAAFVEPASGETIDVVNTLGDVERTRVPAWIQFELRGVACSWGRRSRWMRKGYSMSSFHSIF